MTQARDDEPSFDPRSWVKAGPPAAPAKQASAKVPGKRSLRPALFAGGLAVTVLTLAAVGWALQGRRDANSPPAAEAASSGPRRSLVIETTAQLPDALAACGVPGGEADQAAALVSRSITPSERDLRLTVVLSASGAPGLASLEVSRADGSGVLINVVAGQMRSTLVASNLQTRVKVVRGEIDANSFYSSAVAAGVTDSLVSDFAAAFTFDFDFQREIRPGDIFEAAFEQRVNEAGEAVGVERLVYASLQTQDRSRALYRFQAPGASEPAWYDGNGSNIARSLMRTPVEGARVSSGFGTRFHPVLGYTRAHKGTDFAVVIGTPVYASGDGVVDFVGVHGGHGNYVSIRHNATLKTAYAHLSAYGEGIKVGAQVRQGQQIALSGNTGVSSGPHLHYEIIFDGSQVDPMTFETTEGRKLEGSALTAFRAARNRIDTLRAAQNG